MNPRALIAALLLGGFLVSPGLWAQTGAPIPDSLRDLNQDGTIDFKDLLILIEGWGLEGIETPTPTFTNTSVTVSTETTTPTQIPSDTDTPTETPTPSPTETPTDQTSFDVELSFPTPIPMKMVRIPAGSFMMGSPVTERGRANHEGPVHQVTIGSDFYMGETEVTQAQWEAVMGFNPVANGMAIGPDYPVSSVSWNEAQDFLAVLNGLSGEGNFRLPSEAEWEYACRAGSTKRFYFGNALECSDEACEDCDIDPSMREKSEWSETPSPLPEYLSKIGLPVTRKASEFMWFCANSGTMAHRVRSLRPNAFGLYDMSGNVHEWVQDLYHPNYTGAPTDGSAWVTGGIDVTRVYRGGYFAIEAGFCRSAARYNFESTEKFGGLGLRIVWTP